MTKGFLCTDPGQPQWPSKGSRERKEGSREGGGGERLDERRGIRNQCQVEEKWTRTFGLRSIRNQIK